ncbi:MAG: hypothetical protein AB7R55_03930 [Gemmatimonadales bacterium]
MLISKQVRLRLEKAERVRVFFDAHPLADPGAAPLLARLDALLERAKQNVAQQEEGRARGHAGTVQREDLRRYLTSGLVRMIARVGRAAARSHPEMDGRFQLVSGNGAIMVFMRSGEALLAAAREHAAALEEFGVGPALVDQAEELLRQYQALHTEGNALAQSRTQAVAELESASRELSRIVGQLDGFNRHRFASQPESLAAWKVAKDLRVRSPKRENGSTPDVAEPPPQGDAVGDEDRAAA